MELRMAIATQMAAALIVSPKVNNESGSMTTGEYAALAFLMADALIAQSNAPLPEFRPAEEKND